MGGPGKGVDGAGVACELGGGDGGQTDVQDDCIRAVHRYRRQVVRVLLVPAQSAIKQLV